MRTDWVNSHKPIVQKLVNAFVATQKWIASHSAADITGKLPSQYSEGIGKAAYIKALTDEKGIFTPDGMMPQGGPETVLKVLSGFDPNIKGKSIDLSKTYTTQFVQKANQQTG
jgi:NitT/TauT family transport system substrate-binding protein